MTRSHSPAQLARPTVVAREVEHSLAVTDAPVRVLHSAPSPAREQAGGRERVSDASPLFPPTDVPLLPALPYAQPDPVTRLRRVLSAGDAVVCLVVVAGCLIVSDFVGAAAVLLLLLRVWAANDRESPACLLSARSLLRRAMVVVGLVATFEIFTSDRSSARHVIAEIAAFALAALAWRLLLRVSAVERLFNTARVESVLLVGDFPTVSTTIRRWEARHARVRIAGALLTDGPGGVERRTRVCDVEVYGQLKDAAPAACDLGVSKVVVVGDSVDGTTIRRIGWELESFGIPVAVATQIAGIRPHRSRVDIVGDQTVVELAAVRRRTVLGAVRGAIDRAVAVVVLLPALPILAAVALAVRLESKGPVVFSQERAGQYGKPFVMYKFRTMRVGADALKAQLAHANEVDGVLFKMRKDPRITRIGSFLRSTSLDELPQLINVLRGEMALVGPRPHVLSEADLYDGWAERRLQAKPGLTGLWQVNGRSDLGWEESVLHDLDYVDNWRPGLDLGIVAKTFGAVLKRKGAY